MPNKMERFTQRARRVLHLAQEEAESRQHAFIGTEHVLLGLMREEGGVAGRVLRDIGLDQREMVEHVDRLSRVGQRDPDVKLELLPETKKILELAVDEARQMGHHYIGTEHLLLGLLRQTDVTAIEVLKQLNVNVEMVRSQIQRVLKESPVQNRPPQAINLSSLQAPSVPVTSQDIEHHGICFCYRNDDSPDTSARIRDKLIAHFGSETKVHDLTMLLTGTTLRDYIVDLLPSIRRCEIFMFIVGPNWSTAVLRGSRNTHGFKSMERIEIEAALQGAIPVIPVLVEGAAMPSLEELPDTLHALISTRTIAIRNDPDFESDMTVLIAEVEKHLKK